MKAFRIHSEKLDDIVFENRNKEYGAYELRKSYDKRLIKSFCAALFLIATATCVPVLIYQLVKKHQPPKPTFTTETIEFKKDYKVEKKIEVEAAAPAPRQHAKADVPFQVTKDSLLVKEENKKDTLPKATSPLTLTSGRNDSMEGNGHDTILANANYPNSESDGADLTASATAFDLITVEKRPQFRGGDAAMMRFFEKNIHYSETAHQERVTGKIYASFVINSKGEVEAIKILHGLGYGLDDEVVRVLGIMPAWEPGYYHGKAVSTILNIPVSFNLIQ